MRHQLPILLASTSLLVLACALVIVLPDGAMVASPDVSSDSVQPSKGFAPLTHADSKPAQQLHHTETPEYAAAVPVRELPAPAADRIHVRGRVTHASGASLSGEKFRLSAPVPQGYFDRVEVTLAADGSFAAKIDVETFCTSGEDDEFNAWSDGLDLTTEQIMQALQKRQWGLVHVASAYNQRSQYQHDAHVTRAMPTLDNGVIDLGEMQLVGGMLEIRPEGLLALGGIDFLFHLNHVCSIDDSLSFNDHPVRLLLEPGRYFFEWSPDLDDATEDQALAETYRDLTLPGHCDISVGECTVLNLVLPELEYVQVHAVSEDAPIPEFDVTADWDRLMDLYRGPIICYEPTIVNARVLKTGRSNLSVQVSASGYETRSVLVPDGANKLVVELERTPPGEAIPRQGVTVYCNLPESFTEWAHVILFDTEGRAVHSGSLSHSTSSTVAYCDPGRWRVGVFNGGLNGYPGGMLSGLVEVEVRPQRYATARMPDPLPPPFALASRVGLRFTCGTHDMHLRCPMRTPDGSVRIHENPHDSGPLPTAVVDGLIDVPLSFSNDEDSLWLGTDLPVRVRVTLTGERSSAWAEIKRENGQRACCTFKDNVACLWLPAGTAQLEVSNSNGTIAVQTIEVPGNGTLEVEVENAFGFVELICPDDGPEWLLYRQSDSGWQICPGHWNEETYTLPPGNYRTVVNEPALLGSHDFTVTPGRHTKIELKIAQEFKTGNAFLALPPGLSDIAVEGRINIVTAQLAECMDGDINWRSCWNDVEWRYAPGGITLLDVPLGMEVCLSGSIGRNSLWYQLIPDKTIIAADNLQINAPRWAREREIAGRLSPDVRGRTQWRVAGTLPRVLGSSPPAGEVTMYFTDQQHEIAIALTVPAGEGEFELPEAAANRLRERGWLRDD